MMKIATNTIRDNPAYRHRRALLLADWWSGRILFWINDEAKAAAAIAEANAIALAHPYVLTGAP